MNDSPPRFPRAQQAGRWIVGPTAVLTLCAATTLLGLAVIAPYALPVIILDAIGTLILLVPPMLAGLWFAPLLGLDRTPVRWQLLTGAILGVGSFSLLALGLGLVGVLQRPVWIAILAVLAALGIVRLRSLLSRRPRSEAPPRADDSVGCHRLLWLAVVPFLVAGLLAAANPPGVIWSEEGLGYDVLEYHLQMPKEYLQAGRISYAPHNVYANFPSNLEMLYLINMVLRGEDVETGTSANMIHLCFGVLAVWAAWCVGSTRSRRTGIVCGVSLATAGWLPYLGGLAYVENGLLAFGLLSVGALLQTDRCARGAARASDGTSVTSPRAWFVVCGLAAGFACGCKYTGVPMIAAPVAFGAALVGGSVGARSRAVLLVVGCTLIAFSPWLVKNLLLTGNPVFPLAHGLFHTSPPGWDENVAARWQRGHSFTDDQHDARGAPRDASSTRRPPSVVGARGALLWRNLVADHYQRFGPIVFLFPWLLLGRRRGVSVHARIGTILTFIAAAQLAVWLLATHLLARFAVPLLIPLCLLTGWGATRRTTRGWRVGTAIALLVGAGWNLTYVVRLHQAESLPALPASAIYSGEFPVFQHYAAVNEGLTARARVLILGDARAFYYQRRVSYTTVFNTNPFMAAVERDDNPTAILDWLRASGYTHVLVHWAEIARLRATYGFSASITPALFARLVAAGLELGWEAHWRGGTPAYVQLYSVPGAD